MWKGLLQEPAIPLRVATWVCVDLPGYGGSDSFEKYDTAVLEALTEFIIAMRETFIVDDEKGVAQSNTYVVAHDWGAVLSFRLASEAPLLADRFILTNGPHVSLLAKHSSTSDPPRSSLRLPIETAYGTVPARSSSNSNSLPGGILAASARLSSLWDHSSSRF